MVRVELVFPQYAVDSEINLFIWGLSQQVTSKLDHAHTGIYFICFGAVAGSSGLMSFASTAYLINLEILLDAESFSPNRSRNERFVSCSP